MGSDYQKLWLDVRRWWSEPPATAQPTVVRTITGICFLFESVVAAGIAMLWQGWRFPAWFWQYSGLWGAAMCVAGVVVLGHSGDAAIAFAGTTFTFSVNAPFIYTLRWALLTVGATVAGMCAAFAYYGVPASDLVLIEGSAAGVALIACWIARQSDAVEEDPLTWLPNRRGIYRRFGDTLRVLERDGGALAVALFDIDHFKTINDTYGHETGDRVLTECAHAWRANLRPGTVLGRLGGDEFALLMPDLEPDAATTFVDSLRALTPDGVTISAGVAARRLGDGQSELLRRADRALYDAKAAGRDRTAAYVGA